MTNTVKAVVLLFLFAMIIYSNSLGGEFVSDDEYFIVKNASIRSLENIPLFFVSPSAVAFSELSKDVYRPITTLSYAIDYFLWNLSSFEYHLVNALFHSFNVVLVFLFLFAAFGDVFLAFVAAMLFACHPVQTETVAWISGRSSVLFLFFYLASLILYVLSFKKKKTISPKACIALSLAAYAVSLFSKEMAVTLPLILIAYDAHFNADEPFRKRFYFRYAPYMILTLLFILARSTVLQSMSQRGWWGGNPYHTFLTMMPVLAGYIKVMLAPIDLCAFYVPDIYTSIAHTKILFSLAFLAPILIAMAFLFRRARGASFAMWWFFITLLPVMNIIPLRALMAERFLYLPSIGFCLLMAIVIERIGLIGFKQKKQSVRIIAVALAAVLVVSYSVRTIIRNEDWKNSLTLSRSILKIMPLNPWALASLGEAYASRQRNEEAIKPLLKSIALCDSYFLPRNILGFVYVEIGKYGDAIRVLKDSLRIEPNNLEALNSLGVAYASLKRYDEALKQFERSAKIDPTFVNAYMNIGTVYYSIGRYEEALEAYGDVGKHTRSRLDIAVSYVRMGDVYIKMKNFEKAKEYYGKALALCGRGMDGLKKIATDRLNAKWDIK
jgi:tetratricopeptide (TPR) repeat protein